MGLGHEESLEFIILNFRKTSIIVLKEEIEPLTEKDTLPDFLNKRNDLKLLLSSGDWVKNGVSNVDEHRWYDIHVSYPEPASNNKEDKRNPLDVNAEDAKRLGKIMCFVDYLDESSVNLFMKFFKQKISYIDTLDNRILPNAVTINNLLNANGSVSKKILSGLIKKEKLLQAKNSLFAGGCKTKKSKHNRCVRAK